MPVEYYTTDDLTGESGETDRVLTLRNEIMTVEDTIDVWLDESKLTEKDDYKVTHKDENTEVKFLVEVDDGDEIAVDYEMKHAKGLRIWEKEIELMGEWITIRRVQAQETSDWGDSNEYFHNDIRTKAIFVERDKSSNFEEEGEVFRDSNRFYIKPGLDVSRGDYIKHDDKWYEIDTYKEYRVHGIRMIEILAEST